MDILLNWLQDLPPQAQVFTVCIGNGRELEQCYKTVGAVGIEDGWTPKPNEKNEVFQFEDLEDLFDQIKEVLSDNGFGDDVTKCRIYAKSIHGKHIKSKLITERPRQLEEDNTNAIIALTNSNTQLINQVIRCLTIQTDNNAQLQQTITNVTNSYVEAKQETIQEQQQRLIYEIVAEHAELESSNDTQSQALTVLTNIAETVLAQRAKSGFTTDDLKTHVKTNPDVVKDFMDDPEIIDIVMKSMASE